MSGKLQAPQGVTGKQFAQSLAESGILDSAVFPAESGDLESADGEAVAEGMIKAGRLTKYQAEAVLDRRFADLKIGNYDILDRLGAGGMGTVFKARHRRMKRIVALKVLSKEVLGKGNFAQRFQREVETIARLHHPNIVMAFDADEAECGPFLVMEFVDGRDLMSEVQEKGPLPVLEAVESILQAARGLSYAHSQGIVHRDIKPANLLRDQSGTIKVADLGLARLNKADDVIGNNTSLTQAGTVVGTVDYMPPEQAIDSGEIDHRADIYSLGCSLYYLLSARPPYAGSSIMAVMLRHRDAPIPQLGEARPEVPPELEAVYQRMVAKKPEDRYQSMSEVVAALEAVQGRLKQAVPVPSAPPDTTAAYSPLEPGATGEFEVAPPERLPLEGRVVVLVEPSRTQAGIIRRYMEQAGVAAVHVAISGREAIELARQHRPDVLVTAMHIAEMTGADLAHAIREDPTLHALGIVIATSEADADQAATLSADSRVKLLSKPFDSRQLMQCIASITHSN